MLSDHDAETISIDAIASFSARSTSAPDEPREANKKRKLSGISCDGSELGESICMHVRHKVNDLVDLYTNHPI